MKFVEKFDKKTKRNVSVDLNLLRREPERFGTIKDHLPKSKKCAARSRD
jgi:hypothetical protein